LFGVRWKKRQGIQNDLEIFIQKLISSSRGMRGVLKIKLNNKTAKMLPPLTFAFLLLFAFAPAYAVNGTSNHPSPASFSPAVRVPGIAERISPGITTDYSYNWAGYAADNGKVFTQASGSWIQNSVKCNSGASQAQYAAFWVGIDGLTSSTVEQTGTLAYCAKGASTPHYYAWYEYYPAQSIVIISGFAVHPGDKFLATIVGTSSTSFKVTLKDVTTGKSSSHANPSGFSGSRTSIECITEEPSVNGAFSLLANFGSNMPWGKDKTGITNGGCSGVQGGHTYAVGAFGASSYELISCNYPSCSTVMAQPSGLSSDGTSFTVTWKSAGP
jgi:hypothetical protein